MPKIVDGEQYAMPSTINAPAILGEIEAALKTVGLREAGGTEAFRLPLKTQRIKKFSAGAFTRPMIGYAQL